MSSQVIAARIRGFICLNAHPAGCAANVDAEIAVVNGDAFSREIKEQTIARLKQAGRKLDLVVYSLAAPKRVDSADGVSYSSVLKPLGQPFRSKSINLGNEQVVSVEIAPASE